MSLSSLEYLYHILVVNKMPSLQQEIQETIESEEDKGSWRKR